MLHKWTLSLFVVFVGLSLAFAAADKPVAVDRVIAIVNGDSLTTRQVGKELAFMHPTPQDTGVRIVAPVDIDRVVQKLINDCLLAQEARSIGLDQDSAIASDVIDMRERLAVRTYLKSLIPDSFAVTENDIRTQVAEDFRNYDLQMISTKDSTFAVQLLDSIRRGVSMDSLAKYYSLDQFARHGGRLGKGSLFDLPQMIIPAVRATKVGDLIGPFFLKRLQTIFRINRIIDADTARSDSLRDLAAVHLQIIKRQAAMDSLLAACKQQFGVKVDTAKVLGILDDLQAGRPTTSAPAITVGQTRTLPASVLRRRYQFHVAENQEATVHTILWESVRDNIQRMLLREAAVRKGFDRDPLLQRHVREYEDSCLTIMYLEDAVGKRTSVSDSEVTAYYSQHKSDFRKPTRVQIATITRDSLIDAQNDYKALQSGTSFEWLARRNSIDPWKSNGGVREWMTLEQFPPDTRAALDSLPIGGIIPPHYFNEMGYMIMQLAGRQIGDMLPFSAVESRIRSGLLRKAQLVAINSTVQMLRKNAVIELKADVIKSLSMTTDDKR